MITQVIQLSYDVLKQSGGELLNSIYLQEKMMRLFQLAVIFTFLVVPGLVSAVCEFNKGQTDRTFKC